MIRLLDGIAQHKVLLDNWFTSPALMIKLVKNGFYSLGTLWLYRAPRLSLFTDREIADHGLGSFEEKVCKVDGVQLTFTGMTTKVSK